MTQLVLLSGWGIDARLWQPLVAALPDDMEVITPDWPGYGSRHEESMPDDLATLARAMASHLPPDAIWVGWSLGGLLATALLAHLPSPQALIMIGMRERFTSRQQDPGGVTPASLSIFRDAFAQDSLATWRHFLRWQLAGEPLPRQVHRQLQALIGEVPTASYSCLAVGLDWLTELDNTDICAASPCPIISMSGDRDPLISATDDSICHLARPIDQAGHCPQLSQPDILASRLASVARMHADAGRPSCGRPT